MKLNANASANVEIASLILDFIGMDLYSIAQVVRSLRLDKYWEVKFIFIFLMQLVIKAFIAMETRVYTR